MPSTRDPNSLVILRASYGSLVKTYAKHPQGIEKLKVAEVAEFTPELSTPATLPDLGRLLTLLEGNAKCAVTTSALKDDATLGKPAPRVSVANGGQYESVPRIWLPVDIDGHTPSDPTLPPFQSILRDIPTLLPPEFHRAAFVAHFTGSCGLDLGHGPKVCVRLWFQTTAPVTHAQIKRALKSCPKIVDRSIYRDANLIFTGRPVLRGMVDPFAGMSRNALWMTEGTSKVDVAGWGDAASDPIETVGEAAVLGVERVDAQVRDFIDTTLRREVQTSRHHASLAATIDLLAMGGTEAEAADMVRGILGSAKGDEPPREPQPKEIKNIIVAASEKLLTGTAVTRHPPLAQILTPLPAEPAPVAADDDAPVVIVDDESPESPARDATPSSNDDIAGVEEIEPGDKDRENDRDKAKSYLAMTDARLVNWQQDDYEWTGKCYRRMLPGDLEGRIANTMNLPSGKTAGTAKSVRNLSHIEVEQMPCSISTRAPLTDIVNFANGWFNVRDWLEDPHGTVPRAPTTDHFSTSVLPFPYDPSQGCPTFRRFLDSVWPGDIAQQRECQKMLGYLLLSGNPLHKMFFFCGMTRSGKGVIQRVIQEMIGPVGSSATDIQTLASRFGLSGLIGKQVAVIGEMNLQKRNRELDVATDVMKSIVGGDSVCIDRKNRDPLTQPLPVKIVAASNMLPAFMDSSGAFQHRVVLFHTTISFKGREDAKLEAALKAEITGIMNFALAGVTMLRDDGWRFIEPESVKAIRGDFDRASAPTAAFIADCLIPHDDRVVAGQDLYELYSNWCRSEGHRFVASKNAILAEITQIAPWIKSHRTSKVRGYRGLAITEFGLNLMGRTAQATESPL